MKLVGCEDNVVWNINENRKFLKIKWDDIEDQKTRFVKSISKFDQLRGTNFVETFPELRCLYEN